MEDPKQNPDIIIEMVEHPLTFKTRLAEKGFDFTSNDELVRFSKDRLRIIHHKRSPKEKTLVVDFGADTQKLICTWYDE